MGCGFSRVNSGKVGVEVGMSRVEEERIKRGRRLRREREKRMTGQIVRGGKKKNVFVGLVVTDGEMLCRRSKASAGCRRILGLSGLFGYLQIF